MRPVVSREPRGYGRRMLRDDYLIRLIKQLGAALARIAGRRKSRDFEGALDETGKAWDDLIGQPPRELVDVLDTRTLAEMLKDTSRMRVAAKLLVEEGRAYAGKGDPIHAGLAYRRAYELLLEVRAVAPDGAVDSTEERELADDEGMMIELARLVPANQLDERYRRGSFGG